MKLEPSYITGGILTLENALAVPQKGKHRRTISSSNSTLSIYPRGLKTYTNIPSSMTHDKPTAEQLKCPSLEWINKM